MSVIFNNSFLLSESLDQPARHPRIGYHTWTLDGNVNPGDVTVSTEADDFPGDAPLRPNTYERWKPTALPATWEIDLGENRTFNYFCIGAHTLGSNACTIKVEYQDPSDTWVEFGTETMLSKDRAVMMLDDEVETDTVRLTVSGSGDMPQIGVIYFGNVLAMSRPIYAGHNPITLNRETRLKSSKSRGGQFLGQNFRRSGLVSSVQFQHLEPDWYRDNFDPFAKAARNRPFFFAWRPTTYPTEVAYCWTPDDMQPQNDGQPNFMSVSFNLRGFDDV